MPVIWILELDLYEDRINNRESGSITIISKAVGESRPVVGLKPNWTLLHISTQVAQAKSECMVYRAHDQLQI